MRGEYKCLGCMEMECWPRGVEGAKVFDSLCDMI
jgi:hypothetical protein